MDETKLKKGALVRTFTGCIYRIAVDGVSHPKHLEPWIMGQLVRKGKLCRHLRPLNLSEIELVSTAQDGDRPGSESLKKLFRIGKMEV